MNGDDRVRSLTLSNGVNTVISLIWLFLKTDFSLLFFQFKRFTNYMERMNNTAILLMFFTFNIFIAGLWFSLALNIFEFNDLKTWHIAGMSIEKNTIEYFISFFVTYIFLILFTELVINNFIGCEIDEVHIIKAIVGGTGCFLVLSSFDCGIFMITEYVRYKTGLQFSELFFLCLVFKYVFWMYCMYRSSYTTPKLIKFLILSSTIVVIFAFNIFRIFSSMVVKNTNIEYINMLSKQECRAERRFLDVDNKNGSLISKGYNLSELNRYTETLKDIDELSVEKRFKYKLIFIVTTLMKENVYDKELENILINLLNDNLSFCYEWLLKRKDIFGRVDFKYITSYDLELARVELLRLEELKESYDKELAFEVDYEVEYEEDCEYIVEMLYKVEPLYYIDKYIRFLP